MTDGVDEGSDAGDCAPPAAARVAARTQVLVAQAYRAMLERSAGESAAKAAHATFLAWCDRALLREEFEPREWTLVTTPLGTLTRRESIDAGWLTEAAVCLAWALSCVEFPDCELQVDGAEVANAAWFLDDNAVAERAKATLRPRAELERVADECLTLHWRLREFSQRPVPMDFVAFAARCSWATMRLDRLRLIDGDLSVGGVPLSKAPEPDWRACLSIAAERHRAAEWFLGQHPLYSQVTADT